MAPTIMIAEIKMVMHRLKPIIIFTIHGGNQSKNIVLYVTRTVNVMTIETMDSKMAQTPAIIEPFRNDWQRQQVFKIGLAIFLSREFLQLL